MDKMFLWILIVCEMGIGNGKKVIKVNCISWEIEIYI